MDIYLKFKTKKDSDEHLADGGYPKTGTCCGLPAHDGKQKTLRPFPIEQSGTVRVMQVDESYSSRKNATVITKDEAQALGTFLDHISEGYV